MRAITSQLAALLSILHADASSPVPSWVPSGESSCVGRGCSKGDCKAKTAAGRAGTIPDGQCISDFVDRPGCFQQCISSGVQCCSGKAHYTLACRSANTNYRCGAAADFPDGAEERVDIKVPPATLVNANASSPMRADDSPLLRPKEEPTHKGCTCTGKGSGGVCSASVTQDSARCDWCFTKDSCGRSSIRGHWDYCVYDPMRDFEAQTSTEKMAQLWAKITDPSVVGKSGPNHLAITTLEILVTESVITPFSNVREVMPIGRKKVIHAQGVMCKFDLAVSSASPFTGVLSPGKQSGLIRFGSAASLDEPLVPKIFPGFGIKFLRSGVRSADWVALRTIGDGGSYNFFESPFSNHAAPNAALVKLGKFQQASGCIDMVGLSDACTYTQAGEKVSKPVFPFEVGFEPTGNVRFPDKRKKNADMLKELSTIPDGTDIFTVYAFASPTDKKQGNKITIGTLTTTGACHQTLFGDLDLFFRHQRMEEDFALAPEWIPEMKALGDPVCEATVGPVSKWQCPPPSDEAVIV